MTKTKTIDPETGEVCDVCKGTGEVIQLLNYAGYHYDGDYPETQVEPCEYCVNPKE